MKQKKTKKKTKSRKHYVWLLDKKFSEYIRLRDSNLYGFVVCPLCGKKMRWREAQNMHFISRSKIKYRRDEENCFAGCVWCNVFLKWNYIVYTRFMQKKFGIDKIDQMIADSEITKISTPTIQEMIEMYSSKVCELEAKLMK